MKSCFWKGMAVFAGSLVATTAIAQQQKESTTRLEQEALLKRLATPGEHHQQLNALAGKWTLAVKWRNTPDDRWTESQGVADYKWIHGGFV